MRNKWILKAVVQKTISYLPYSQNINFFFQRYITKGVLLSTDYLEDRLGHAQKHLAFFSKHVGSLEGKSTLELGAGWYPVVPISLFLQGAGEVHTFDISNLLDTARLRTTMEKLLAYQDNGRLADFLQPLPERMAVLRQVWQNSRDTDRLDDLLQPLRIRYHVRDARQSGLADNSIDLVHSNNTFEHVYPRILEEILSEFRRISNKKSGGLMSHFIDLSDHFAHFDPSITIYNFLRFSEKQWAWIDNSVQPLNRLRFPDYLAMYRRLDIPVTETDYRPGDEAVLRSIKIDLGFAQKYSMADLAISHGYVVSKMCP